MFARSLVLGDIVHIALGDRVPADIRLIEVGVVRCGLESQLISD